MAEAFTIDPAVARHFIVTDVLCGLVFCNLCKREPLFVSAAPELSDRHRYDQALAMFREGWELLSGGLEVLCPECAATRRAL
jgi:hypothetical protein